MPRAKLAIGMLLTIGFMWGAAFVFMKDAIAQQPFMDFLATRFTLATILLLMIQPKQLKGFERRDLKIGIPAGVLLAGTFITQTIGLELTTAAISGFLTGLYVVFTPLLGWLVFRSRVSGRVGVGSLVALSGLGLLSGAAASSVELQIGQIWLIACAVIAGFHFIVLGRFSSGMSSYRLTTVQIATVAVICWVFALHDGYQAPPNEGVWIAVVFTAAFATVFAFWGQTWAQARLDPARVAIVMSSEVIFAALIAVAVGQEVLSVTTLMGGALMFGAMLIIEWPSRKSNQIQAETKL
jgi:drug/metabolite transporter (DMT)-like permease